MNETHDMEMTCTGDTHGDDGFLHVADCTFQCRIKANSHEEGLRQAAELHKQQREEQIRLREEARKQNERSLLPLWVDELPQVTICDKLELWVYPEPCWDCFWEESMPKEYKEQMAQAAAFFANIALHGMPRPN